MQTMIKEPLEIAQCIGCSTDVAIYSSRQYLDGEAFCSCCRKIARKAAKKEAAMKKAKVEQAAAVPVDLCAGGHSPALSPTGVRFCLRCLNRV